MVTWYQEAVLRSIQHVRAPVQHLQRRWSLIPPPDETAWSDTIHLWMNSYLLWLDEHLTYCMTDITWPPPAPTSNNGRISCEQKYSDDSTPVEGTTSRLKQRSFPTASNGKRDWRMNKQQWDDVRRRQTDQNKLGGGENFYVANVRHYVRCKTCNFVGYTNDNCLHCNKAISDCKNTMG